ncbi:MAG TPA: RsmE family RNA methyltransferase [Candidatus Acidoferrum sp.]|jgi:16S rRNA (uracil1498-N3)-methyltransferase|nr:RsmE family RNA methyltransferase [Candidatus Acidoferrum sp.]
MEGEAAHHLGRVLRAQIGQRYELSDGERVWLGEIASVGRDRVEFALVEELPAHQPSLDVTFLLSVVKFDMFEWAIEKATELGVTTIVPLSAARSEKALVTAATKRAERWKKILLESSQQSRRVRVPVLGELAAPENAFASHKDGLRVLLSERPDSPSIRKVLEGQHQTKAALAIGPEGGWTEAEFDCALRYGFQEASLGKLILRTETAVIAALSSINYAFAAE